MKLSLAVLFLTMCFAPLAKADSSKISDCTRLWQLEKEAGCPAAPADAGLTPIWQRDYKQVNKTFGPSKCVTDDNVDHEVGLLEDKCNKWLAERKGDLKSKYLTGTCDQDCNSCPKNETLQKCTMKGEVHYKVSSTDAPN